MKSQLHTMDLTNKRVFLRADLNVPLQDGLVTSDHRLEALRPTLDLLTEKKARIILATHLGRPKGYDKHLSTKQLLKWFETKGYPIIWVSSLDEAQTLIELSAPGTIVLLENLRFNKEEHDLTNKKYVQKLKALTDIYVTDAWAVLHKQEMSITVLPTLYDKQHKTIGLLVEKELAELQPLLEPKKPYTIIMGGSKIKQKLPLIEQALNKADTIIILPPLAFTLLKAQRVPIGISLVDDRLIGVAQKILTKAAESATQLLLPQDFLISLNDQNGPLETVTQIPHNGFGIALGPESLNRAIETIHQSKTVFLNGTMGFFDRPETLEPLKRLLQSIAHSNNVSVIGGGDSVAAVTLFNLEQSISFCSTGGGSTLSYILNGTLPGLAVID